MAISPATARKSEGYWGAALAAAGFLALLINLFLATPFSHILATSKGFAGTVSTLGLSVLRTAGAFALGQVDYFSLSTHILVLFSAMLAVIFGIALMRSHSRAADKIASTSSTFSAQENG